MGCYPRELKSDIVSPETVLPLVNSSVWEDCPTSGIHQKPCVVACDHLNFQYLSLLRGRGMAGSLHRLILPGSFWWPAPSSGCLGSPASDKQKTFTCPGILEGFMSYARNREETVWAHTSYFKLNSQKARAPHMAEFRGALTVEATLFSKIPRRVELGWWLMVTHPWPR